MELYGTTASPFFRTCATLVHEAGGTDHPWARANYERRQVRGRGAQHIVFRRTLLTPLEPVGL